ncbi:hypothetical protein BAUCODRAFT_263957 [Baudoinia panamericana UAMH 10762]|uniref:Uncharacterized protein n=1 Tax=Baudoinia panamericana (strain UAMH 10762) TaxID=717646 RepID=M2N2E7_BAUPA|nr:uncharacterized protein BAUCODRAFT_263957 [Baudoinia panamericana UAMH 10762]EMC92845.1 hypothetical protein BAUCODRAFT_263957 [Baudoinia panamericana UAMH 10762]
MPFPTSSHSRSTLLRLEIPACDLNPDPTWFPYLEAPLLAPFVHAPPLVKQLAGIRVTPFWASLPVIPGTMPPDRTHEPHTALLAAVDVLSAATGESSLKVFGYLKADGATDYTYRCRLTTKFHTMSTASTTDYEMTGAQFDRLRSMKDQSQWLSALDSLVSRMNYRAIYHVRERLQHYYGAAVALNEEHLWREATWGSQAKELVDDPKLQKAVRNAKDYVQEQPYWLSLDREDTITDKVNYFHTATLYHALAHAHNSLAPPPLIEQISICPAPVQSY